MKTRFSPAIEACDTMTEVEFKRLGLLGDEIVAVFAWKGNYDLPVFRMNQRQLRDRIHNLKHRHADTAVEMTALDAITSAHAAIAKAEPAQEEENGGERR